MKHILSYKLFEEAKIGDFLNPENNKIINPPTVDTNTPLTTWVGISNEMNETNPFNIKYNRIIKLSYNDSEEHSIRGDKRMFQRTNMTTTDFNKFIKKAFDLIYPTYFFKGMKNLENIEHKDLPFFYKKTYMLVVDDKKFEKKYFIPYMLSKRYNYKTNEYDFFINIISILNNFDMKKTYKLFYLTVSELGEISLDRATTNFEYWFTPIPQSIKDSISEKEEKEKELSVEIKKRRMYNEEPMKPVKNTFQPIINKFDKPKINKNNL